jgi:SAM-dependent methyltransferase
MTAFDTLAEHYHAGRLGYSGDLYNALFGYGMTPGMRVLDVGCGTGLASAPLVANGYHVTGIDPSEPMLAVARGEMPASNWIAGSAEHLPFEAQAFDAVVTAQTVHHLDRAAAVSEMHRVVRRGGIAAVWWKHLVTGDGVKHLRDSVAREFGMQLPASGLTGGFKEFYGAGWSETSLRVFPWRTSVPVSQYLELERSRAIVRAHFGDRTGAFIDGLEQQLIATYGAGDPLIPLNYTQYLYLGKK